MASPATHPTGASSSAERNLAFDNAYQSFYDSLPEHDQISFAPYASAQDLETGLTKLKALARHHQKQIFLSLISRFTKALQPYLNIVDIMVSSNPQYTALVWGALRFILQIASTFSSFFDQLLRLLGNIAVVFPQYEKIGKFCTENPTFTKDLRLYVEKLYGDLFQLFISVARIFTSKHKTLKRTSTIIGELFWKPFEIRFPDFMRLFQDHRDFIIMEIGLIQARLSQNTDDIVRQEKNLNSKARQAIAFIELSTSETEKRRAQDYKDSNKEQVRIWLSPPAYEEAFHRSQALHEDDTNSWIFGKVEFSTWATNEWRTRPAKNKRQLGSNTLWIQGNAGCGKTVLASSIIHGLRNNILPLPQKTDVYYYFFDSQNSEAALKAASAYRSILAQIIHYRGHDEVIIDKLAFLRTSQSDGSAVATSTQLSELMKICLISCDGVLVLDAIDECLDNDTLIQDVHWLSENSRTKIVLLSRPNVTSLVRTVPKRGRLMIPKDSIRGDIRKYLQTQIEILVEDDFFPPATSAQDIIIPLLHGADGMFLWARLMVGYLKSPALPPSRRLKEVSAVLLPEELAQMYRRIITLIDNSDKPQRSLAQKAIQWILCSVTPLTFNELHEALVFEDENPGVDTSNNFKDFEDTISIVTGGLVETTFSMDTDSNENKTFVRFIHLTAMDFFHLASDQEHGLIPSRCISNLLICHTCVSCIIREAPKETQKAAVGKNLSIPASNNKLIHYAARSWVQHFEQIFCEESSLEVLQRTAFCLDCKKLLAVLSRFFVRPLAVTAWVELFYRLANKRTKQEESPFLQFRVPPGLVQFAKQGVSEVSQEAAKIVHIMTGFAQDIEQLEQDWGGTLIESPQVLWDEATAFRKYSFLAGNSNTQVTSMVPKDLEQDASSSSEPLSVISKSGYIEHLGHATAVVSIWPSDSFRKGLQNKQSLSHQDCTDWKIHYEIWRHGRLSVRVIDIRLPLNPNEIWIQLRQSLRSLWGARMISFPVVISDSLLCFVVLRTVFKVQAGECGNDHAMKSALIPMEFSEDIKRFWSPADRENGWFYTYSFRISPGDLRIFFSDSATNTVHGEIYSSHIAAFEMGFEREFLVKLQGAGPFDETELIQGALFHPVHSFVVLIYPFGLKLWNYTQSPSRMNLFWERGKGTWWNGEVKFSDCGGFILMPGQQEEVPIPYQYLSVLPGRPESSSDQGERVISSEAVGSFRKAESSLFDFRPGQLISSGSQRTIATGKGMETISVGSHGAITLNVQDTGGNKVRSLHLLSIPHWNQYQETTDTVILPAKDADEFKIIIDRDSEKAYSLDQHHEEKFPLVVKRDISKIYMEIEGARLASSIDEVEGDSIWDIGSSNPKRSKFR